MRKAKQIWEAYRDNANYQDYMETALASLVAAGGQAIFTDMGADEIAISTALGAGAALAMRPGMARIGRAIGRPIDKRFPGMNDIVDNDPMMASMMFGSPGNLRYLEKNFKDEAGQALQGLAKADNVEINLITKNINIFMNNNEEKIEINSKKSDE